MKNLLAVCTTAGLLAALLPGPAVAQSARRALGSDTSNWAGISGQLRLRGESWGDYGAGSPAGADLDDAFGLSRVMVRGELHLGGRFTAVAEVKSSLATERTLPGGVRTSDEDQLDVQQLYAEAAFRAGGAELSARAGRYDLVLGRERLLSPSDWSNSKRAFQGAGLRLRSGRFEARGFWARPVTVRSEQANRSDSLRQIYGATASVTNAAGLAEAYWLRSESRVGGFNGTTGAERRHTIGARVNRAAAAGRFDLDVEAAYQLGSVGGEDVGAWMVGSQLGWSMPDDPVRWYAGFDYASGDDQSGGAVETFNQLYPLAHANLGLIDMQARQNVVALSLGTVVRPGWNLSVQLEGLAFRRASAADAWYGDDGGVLRAGPPATSRRVGEELDLTVRRPFARGRIIAQAGASYYFAGPFIRETGPAANSTWIYGQVTASF